MTRFAVLLIFVGLAGAQTKPTVSKTNPPENHPALTVDQQLAEANKQLQDNKIENLYLKIQLTLLQASQQIERQTQPLRQELDNQIAEAKRARHLGDNWDYDFGQNKFVERPPAPSAGPAQLPPTPETRPNLPKGELDVKPAQTTPKSKP